MGTNYVRCPACAVRLAAFRQDKLPKHMRLTTEGKDAFSAECVECGFAVQNATSEEIAIAGKTYGALRPLVDRRIPVHPPPLGLYADSHFHCPVCGEHHSGMTLLYGRACACGAQFVDPMILQVERSVRIIKLVGLLVASLVLAAVIAVVFW